MISMIKWFLLSFCLPCVLNGQINFSDNGQEINNYIGRSVVLADFNNDGALDAFVNNEDNFRVYFGDNTGQFSKSTQQLTKTVPLYGKPVVADFNDDNSPDVLTCDVLWINNGSGIFSADTTSVKVRTGESLGTAKAADLNGDGNIDIFGIVNFNALRVYINDGNSVYDDSGQNLGDGTIGGGQIANIVLGDLNGDGHIDAVTAGWRWNNSIPCPNHIWLNDGTGTFTETVQDLEEGESHVHGLEIGDLNNDGSPDIVMAIQDNGRSGKIYFNDGSGLFTSGGNIGSKSGESPALYDFNNDGTLDILMSQSDRPDRIWLNDGQGNLTDAGVSLGNNCTWDSELGDLNADGKQDIFSVSCIWNNSGLSAAPAKIWLNTSVTSVKENDGSSIFSVFPNPCKESITVSLPSPDKELLLTLFDMQGRPVMAKMLTGENVTIELNGLSPGIYLLNFGNRREIRSQMLLIN